MTSSLPCKDCFTGELTTAIPSGKEIILHGLNTYIALPSATAEDGGKVSAKGIIVMIPDAFGWTMPNNRVLCDVYAKKGGYLVLLPDFMSGSLVPNLFYLLDPSLFCRWFSYHVLYLVTVPHIDGIA